MGYGSAGIAFMLLGGLLVHLGLTHETRERQLGIAGRPLLTDWARVMLGLALVIVGGVVTYFEWAHRSIGV